MQISSDALHKPPTLTVRVVGDSVLDVQIEKFISDTHGFWVKYSRIHGDNIFDYKDKLHVGQNVFCDICPRRRFDELDLPIFCIVDWALAFSTTPDP